MSSSIIALLPPVDNQWYLNGLPSIENEKATAWVNHAIAHNAFPDQEKVISQYQQLILSIKNASAEILLLENTWIQNPDNAVFVRDAFISDQSSKIILSKFRKQNRIAQASEIWEQLKLKLKELWIWREIILPPDNSNLFFEWWDFRYIPKSKILFSWYNENDNASRNSYEGVRYVQSILWITDDKLIIISWKGFHLDTVMGVVTDNDWYATHALICKNLVNNYDEVKKKCEMNGLSVVEIASEYGIFSPDLGNSWATWAINTLNIGNTLINWWVFDRATEDLLERIWSKRSVVNLDQFWLAGWGAHCLTNQV